MQNIKDSPDNSCPALFVYLKEVIAIRAGEFAAEHAAPLEIYGQNRTGTDHCDPVSPRDP
jgi:hypothetical protein